MFYPLFVIPAALLLACALLLPLSPLVITVGILTAAIQSTPLDFAHALTYNRIDCLY